jgi:hypothetical protein
VFPPAAALTPVRDGCYPWKASGIPEGIELFTVILGRRGLAIFFMGLLNLNPKPNMLANQRSVKSGRKKFARQLS